MAQNSIERPQYYQGQYLGAEDFTAEQSYHRDMRRRHNLGPHAWGIVIGLQLVLEDQEAGSGKDVFIEPGLAIDGYGREIIALRRHKLDPAAFLSFTVDNHYQVWIAYDEEGSSRPAWGYGGCDDQFDRVLESFRVLVQPSEPEDYTVVVDGETLEKGDPPLPPDLSVPYQELPQGEDGRWLLRLGSVRWNGSGFVDTVAGKLSEGRLYHGAVAARLLAPAGALRIHDRAIETLSATDAGVAVTVEGSLQVERDIIAKDDIHVDGGKLDFRKTDGSGGEEFAITRAESAGGDDLRLQVPVSASGGHNRVVAGYTSGGGFTGALFVTDEGLVGVAAGEPEHPLQVGDASAAVTLAIRGPDSTPEAATLAFQDDLGATGRWFKLFYNSQANLLKVTSAEQDPILTIRRIDGLVGIGTDDPDRMLTVHSGEGTYINTRANDGAIEALFGADNNGAIVSAMTNHDLQLRAGGNSTKMTIKTDGHVGIGTTAPQSPLHIPGTQDVSLTGHGLLLLGSVNGLNTAYDNNEIQARNNGAASILHLQREGGELRIHDAEVSSRLVVVTTDGNLGIGAASPAAKLDVRGSIRLGPSGLLFAMSAASELRVVAGSISGTSSSGTDVGYSYTQPVPGEYLVTFTDSFASTPVVVASSRNAADEDHIITLRSVSEHQFRAIGRDVGNLTGDIQQTSFNFIAMGAP